MTEPAGPDQHHQRHREAEYDLGQMPRHLQQRSGDAGGRIDRQDGNLLPAIPAALPVVRRWAVSPPAEAADKVTVSVLDSAGNVLQSQELGRAVPATSRSPGTARRPMVRRLPTALYTLPRRGATWGNKVETTALQVGTVNAVVRSNGGFSWTLARRATWRSMTSSRSFGGRRAMSFQQGLSGPNSSAKALDVISNNVANAGTVGFKTAGVHFSDVFAASLSGGALPRSVSAPSCRRSSSSSTQGNITTTNNPLDISINGGGFFRMSQ